MKQTQQNVAWQENGSRSYLISIVMVAVLGGLLFGYDTAVISGTIDIVGHQFSLDALQKG